MRLFKLMIGLAVAAVTLTALIPAALAATPQYSAFLDGSNGVHITISNADAFAQINFYARQSGITITTITNLGRTDQFGNYSATLNPGINFSQGIATDTYVSVNGQQSTIVTLNSNNSCFNSNNCNTCFASQFNCNNQITASQTNVTLNSGNSTTVTIFNNSSSFGGSFFISNAPNSFVASASLSGNSLNILANNSGSTSLQICSSNNSSACVTIFITVNGSNNNGGTVTFSNNNLVLTNGQTTTASVFSNGSIFLSNFFVSNNSNPSVASASINGNQITIFGNSNQSGSTTFTVCANNSTNSCGSLLVTVNNNNGNGGLQLSPSSVFVSVGQTVQATGFRSGFNDTLYVSSSTNPAIASASIIGNNITVYGATTGTTTLNICTVQGSACAPLSVTVNGGNVLGTATFPNGTLVSDNGTIYIIYRNLKAGFTNFPAFTGLGFKLSNVLSASTSNVSASGFNISTASQSHPWGSWVQSGGTVYFVSASGLIPITSYDIFLNNGGQDRLVVPMNTFDFQQPLLPVMTFNDTRLR